MTAPGMRVLVTGPHGQVGRELVEVLADAAVVVEGLDVGDRDSVMQAVSTVRPDTVVHAAAWTDVDGCEGDADKAMRVNALGTRHVAEAARRAGARVCYLSTDYVFDGTRQTGGYHEWDEPNPLSVYGRSKLAGERALSPDDTVVRTSWVFGRHGRNVVKTVLALAADPDRALRFVDDQRGCPTAAADLARVVRRLVAERRAGTFHVTNQGPATWLEFAREVVRLAGHDPERVQPITTAELGRPAPRPPNSVLDNAALRLSGMPLLPHWREPLELVVKELGA
jgi:dTDP-4-dehydrorhamnose reductase